MQLSRHSDYTLRVLMYLAARPAERATLAGIAGFFGISLEHLRKVVHQLAGMGYVRTYQGRNGGIELAGTPDSVNVGAVLKELEGAKPLIDCRQLGCRLAPACTLNRALRQAQIAFFDTLSEFTLADLIAEPAMIHGLLPDDRQP